MKWIDNVKSSMASTRDALGQVVVMFMVMTGAVVVIAVELFVICIKIGG